MPKRKWLVRSLWFIVLCILLLAGISRLPGPVRRSFEQGGSRAIRALLPKPGQKPKSVPQRQYEALLEYPRNYGRHEKYRPQWLAERGVPPEQRNYESCRKGAQTYLQERWHALCAERMEPTEALELKVLDTKWLQFSRKIKELLREASGFGLDVTELRGNPSAEAVSRGKELLARLCEPRHTDPDPPSQTVPADGHYAARRPDPGATRAVGRWDRRPGTETRLMALPRQRSRSPGRPASS